MKKLSTRKNLALGTIIWTYILFGVENIAQFLDMYPNCNFIDPKATLHVYLKSIIDTIGHHCRKQMPQKSNTVLHFHEKEEFLRS